MRVASYVEEAEQIEVLAVHVSKDFDGSLQVEEHRLGVEHLDDLVDQEFDRFLVEFNRFSPGAAFDLNQLRDDRVKSDLSLDRSVWRYEVLIFRVLRLSIFHVIIAHIEFGLVIGRRQAIFVDRHMLQRVCDGVFLFRSFHRSVLSGLIYGLHF